MREYKYDLFVEYPEGHEREYLCGVNSKGMAAKLVKSLLNDEEDPFNLQVREVVLVESGTILAYQFVDGWWEQFPLHPFY